MKPKNAPALDDIEDEDDTREAKLEDRTVDYGKYKYVQKQLGDIYSEVEKGFENKREQDDIINECWDTYHCQLNENQVYSGSSQVYVPIIRDAMAARETRFVNMLFPQTGRYTDIVGNDGKVPYDLVALMDYYVRAAKLRTKIAPGLLRTGDVSGQYALYVDWVENTRNVVSKKKVAEMETELGTPVDGSPEYDDMTYEEVVDERPGVIVLDPRNLCILPASAEDIESANIVAVRIPFTKARIKEYIKKGVFEKEAGETLVDNMNDNTTKEQPNTAKKASAAAGVKTDGKGDKIAMVWQVWTKLKIRGEYRRMVTHYGGQDLILGCKRNPYWCDRVPVITQAVEKNPDSIWGASQVYPVVKIQYQANDVTNMGFDSAQYALLPIVMTDPEKNPRAGSMILAMASVWLVDPNSTKFASFPALWKDAFQMVAQCKDQIFQSLGVNPAMIPHGNAGKKPSQAQIAQEQQVALESAADNTAMIQEGVLAELVEWFYELDYQYRDKAVTVKKFGQLGLQATMEQVEPFQVRQRYEFKWYGTEGFKAAQQVQQMISWMGVLTKLPPQQLNGRKLDLGPILEYVSEVTFGPRIAPNVLIDQRHQLTMAPETENQLIDNDFPVQVHDMDDDQAHIQSHYQHFQDMLKLPQDMQQSINQAILARGHILEHIKAAKAKAAAAMGAQPGSMGAPGQPKVGAQIQAPTGPQQPPGAVSAESMPTAMPA